MHHMILLMPLLALVLFILLPWQLALPLYLPVLMGSLLVHWKIIQAQRQPPITGKRAMIGGRAMVVKSEFGEVVVQDQGLVWNAASAQPLQPGQRVTIRSVEGLTLQVTPLGQGGDEDQSPN